MADFKVLPTVNGVNVALITDRGGFGGDSVEYVFDTTTTDSDPGSGKLRFNNATFASITRIFLDDLDAGGNDIQAWIDQVDDSTSFMRGQLRVFKKSDPTVYRIFNITAALTDPGGYTKITVTPIVSNGSLSNADVIVMSFARTGDKGDIGLTGSTGATGATGATGGVSINYTYSSTSTDSDPGVGFIRFNNSNPFLATQLFADNQDTNTIDVTAILDSYDDSSSTIKGFLMAINLQNPSTNWVLFSVSGSVVDGTGYRKISVTKIASAGAPFTNNPLSLSFTRNGDKGDDANVGSAINSATTDDTLDDTDTVGYTTGSTLKKTAWSVIKSTLKTYFDGLYGLLASANTWTGVNAFNNTTTVGTNHTFNPTASGVTSRQSGSAYELSAQVNSITTAQTWTLDITLVGATARVSGVIDLSINGISSSAVTTRVLYRISIAFYRVNSGDTATIAASNEIISSVANVTLTGPTAIANGVRYTIQPTAQTLNRSIGAVVTGFTANTVLTLTSTVA